MTIKYSVGKRKLTDKEIKTIFSTYLQEIKYSFLRRHGHHDLQKPLKWRTLIAHRMKNTKNITVAHGVNKILILHSEKLINY